MAFVQRELFCKPSVATRCLVACCCIPERNTSFDTFRLDRLAQRASCWQCNQSRFGSGSKGGEGGEGGVWGAASDAFMRGEGVEKRW